MVPIFVVRFLLSLLDLPAEVESLTLPNAGGRLHRRVVQQPFANIGGQVEWQTCWNWIAARPETDHVFKCEISGDYWTLPNSLKPVSSFITPFDGGDAPRFVEVAVRPKDDDFSDFANAPIFNGTLYNNDLPPNQCCKPSPSCYAYLSEPHEDEVKSIDDCERNVCCLLDFMSSCPQPELDNLSMWFLDPSEGCTGPTETTLRKEEVGLE